MSGNLSYHILRWYEAIGINKIRDRLIHIIALRPQKPSHAYIYGSLICDRSYIEDVGLWKLVVEKQNDKILSLFYTNQSHID